MSDVIQDSEFRIIVTEGDVGFLLYVKAIGMDGNPISGITAALLKYRYNRAKTLVERNMDIGQDPDYPLMYRFIADDFQKAGTLTCNIRVTTADGSFSSINPFLIFIREAP